METLDDKLIKPEHEIIGIWKLLLWPVLIGLLIGAITYYVNAITSLRYFRVISEGGISYLYPYEEFVITVGGALSGGIYGGLSLWYILSSIP